MLAVKNRKTVLHLHNYTYECECLLYVEFVRVGDK